MKIDFYDLFLLHTPEEQQNGNGENHTAAVKSAVLKRVAADGKPFRRRKFKSIIAAAAAAVIVTVSTFSASALGLIDLENIFGGWFDKGFEHLEQITAVPQNAIVTGDDRLSIRVLGIGGTQTETIGTIEIKRVDGGVFPESGISASVWLDNLTDVNKYNYAFSGCASGPNVIDETTALYRFRIYRADGKPIVGTDYTLTFEDIAAIRLSDEFIRSEEAGGETLSPDKPFDLFEKSVIMEGKWSISFPLEYRTDSRTVSADEPVELGKFVGKVTEIKVSAIAADITAKGELTTDDPFGDVFGEMPLEIKLRNGLSVGKLSFTVQNGHHFDEDTGILNLHYEFDTPVDIDAVESVTINGTVIQVK